MTRILIAHASKYGSAEEVARYLGAVLRDRGASCVVAPVGDVEDVDGYDVVVLGTGLYMGRMHRAARHFLKRHHEALGHKAFAAFGMGPLSNEEAEKEKVRPQLERGLGHYAELEPVAIAIFGGVLDPEKVSFPFRRMPAGDYRDWDEIRDFALALPRDVPLPA